MSTPAPIAAAPALTSTKAVDMNHIEAWKGVIEFTRTVMSIAAALLAAFVSYIVLNGREISGVEFVSPGLLVISVLLSLYGFGGALTALKSGSSDKPGIVLSNGGALALILAICALPFTLKPNAASIDRALVNIESAAKKFPVELAAKNCRSIERRGDSLVMTYESSGKRVEVVYSIPMDRIESVK